jgi:two-component system, NarL family, response regulator NreC
VQARMQGPDSSVPASAPRVALAMPELLVAESLAHVLRRAEWHVVGCYDRSGPLVVKIARCEPELVVLDPRIDDSDGQSSTLERVRAASARTRVAVLTGDVDPKLARALVRYGVRGVILRSGPASDAISVMRQILDGQVVFPSSVMDQLAMRDEREPLSERQREVLEHLAAGHSNDEIARRLFISRNTVKFHLRVIYERLGVRNRVDAARCLQDGR